MNRPNEITFDGEKAWEQAVTVIEILLKQGYTATIRQEDFNIIVINFDYADEEICNYVPYWLTTREKERLLDLEAEETDEDS